VGSGRVLRLSYEPKFHPVADCSKYRFSLASSLGVTIFFFPTKNIRFLDARHLQRWLRAAIKLGVVLCGWYKCRC
jgi:hypothetical protein